MKHNFHAIIGPNGMCECGVRDDGTVVTCGSLLEQEIAALHGSEAGPQEAREELQRLANVGATDTVSQFLAEAMVWAQCDLSQHGEGPSGGYVLRLQRARKVHEAWLSRSEAGVSARVLEMAYELASLNHVNERHRGAMDVCKHPDCRAALGVSPAAPEKELT